MTGFLNQLTRPEDYELYMGCVCVVGVELCVCVCVWGGGGGGVSVNTVDFLVYAVTRRVKKQDNPSNAPDLMDFMCRLTAGTLCVLLLYTFESGWVAKDYRTAN